MRIHFNYSGGFVRDVIALRKRYRRVEDDIEALKAEMREQVFRGVLMPGQNVPMYKVRVANRSTRRGKRGGFRVIYIHYNDDNIFFLHIYSKTDKNDASPGEILERLRDIG